MNLIAQNLANASTTRTEEGEPYRRKMAVFREIPQESSFRNLLSSRTGNAGGVEVSDILADPGEFKAVYDPSHPDAGGTDTSFTPTSTRWRK
jgi:flagellar basal-body rod protein FlgC